MSLPLTASATHSDDIHALFLALSLQAKSVLLELDGFARYVASLPAASQPDIPLNKFRSDVQREANLLRQHGHTLGFDECELQSPLSGADTSSSSITDATDVHHDSVSNHNPDPNVATGNSTHRIRSSNIGHLAVLWDTMTRCTGIVAVRKQIRYVSTTKPPVSPTSRSSRSNRNARNRSEVSDTSHSTGQGIFRNDNRVRRQDKEPVTIDIISEHGGTWIKLFTKSLAWTMMDLAKEGCVDLTSSSSDASDVENDGIKELDAAEDGLAEVKLVKMAREVLAASRTARFGSEHRHPDVLMYLTKISRGMSQDVDVVLEHIERMGIKVVCADEAVRGYTPVLMPPLHNDSDASEDHPSRQSSNGCPISNGVDISNIFARMISTKTHTQLTETLNIDCTILIALISDISHLHHNDVVIPSHYYGRPAGKDIETQLESEPHDPLLKSCIYPILVGKRLVCTAKAAAHLRNIVRIMGSESETKRSWIFLPVGPEDRRSRDDLNELLAKVSRDSVPGDLQLPIEVVETDSNASDIVEKDTSCSLETEVMRRIARHPRLSPLNQSVFYYGWQKGITTVSLNRVVSEWLDRAIDGTLNEIEAERGCRDDIAAESGFRGPKVMICGRERSLLGNEK